MIPSLSGDARPDLPDGPPRREPPRPRPHTADAAANRQLTDLVDSIQENLKAQVQGADVLVGSLDRLADGLERLPQLAKSEAGTLEKIAADVAAATGGFKRLEVVLAQWPQLIDAHRESNVTLTHELERTRQSHDRLVATLETLQRALAARDTTMEQAMTLLREMRADACRREERLNQLAAHLSQRFLWSAAAMAGVLSLGLVLALIALFRS
jgi:uncharacterized phage infection (PIP) family protein YhgE